MVNALTEMGTPTVTMLYDVYTRDGKTVPAFVYLRTEQRSYPDSSHALVVTEDGAVASVFTNELAVDLRNDNKMEVDPGDYANMLYGKSDAKLLTSGVDKDRPLMILFEDGTIYGPCELSPQETNDTSKSFDIWTRSIATQGRPTMIGNTAATESQMRYDRIIISDQVGAVPKFENWSNDRILLAGEKTKVFYVSQPRSNDESRSCCPVKTFDILPLSEVDLPSLNKKASFSYANVGGPYGRLQGRVMLKADAVESIMSTGLTVKQAMQVIADATPMETHYVVCDSDARPIDIVTGRKLAMTLRPDDMHNDYAFSQPSQQPEGVGGRHIPVREVYAMQEKLPSINVMRADTGNAPWSSENTPYNDPMVSDSSKRDQQSEAKDVLNNPERLFENAMFVNMINYANPAVEREALISSLIKSCTGVGRSYFLLLVHGDEFAEAYGLGDADDLGAKLLTQLEGAGKILVTLFSRSISAGSDLALTSMSN
jgi:hypothetical protein